MTKSIPEKYLKMMLEGICPNCERPMIINMLPTHTIQQLADCEEKFRYKVNIHHEKQYVSRNGKFYEVDAKYEKRDKNRKD